jgi:hypothetical protein
MSASRTVAAPMRSFETSAGSLAPISVPGAALPEMRAWIR